MGKEIITHFDNGAQLPACGVYGWRRPTTDDRDKVTCMLCKRTLFYRGIIPSWYEGETAEFRNMDNARLISELGNYMRHLWYQRDKIRAGILIREIRHRMVE